VPTRETPTRETTAATDLFIALGAVIKRLRHIAPPEDDQLRAALARNAPAPRHVAALVHIASDGPIGISELAERLGVSLATMSQVVTELGDWGLVERKTDEADRRRALVTVTPAHRPTTKALLDCRLRPIQRTLRRLSPGERDGFLRGLTVLAEELDVTKQDAAR
jgi:DNA-binding MarR family transcriptional regulator